MKIRTWQELKALSNNQWPDDECMKEEIAQLRAELSQPVSMEPAGYHIGPDGERRNHYTADQLAAARQQGAEEVENKWLDDIMKMTERIADLEKSNAQLLEALKDWMNWSAEDGLDLLHAIEAQARAAIAAAEVKP